MCNKFVEQRKKTRVAIEEEKRREFLFIHLDSRYLFLIVSLTLTNRLNQWNRNRMEGVMTRQW